MLVDPLDIVPLRASISLGPPHHCNTLSLVYLPLGYSMIVNRNNNCNTVSIDASVRGIHVNRKGYYW